MGLFSKFSIPNSFSKKKTLATFDLKVDKPKYTGDIPNATIKFYDDFQ